MTTLFEQQLLFGRMYPEDLEPEASNILADFFIADLKAGPAVFFAALVLLGAVAGYWGDLAPWLSVTGSSLALSLQAVLTGVASLLRQLLAVRSWQGLQTMLLDVKGRLTRPILHSRLVCFVAFVFDWVFPFNSPMTTVAIVSGAFICGTSMYFGFLLPVSWYLYGASAGLRTASVEMSPACWHALRRFDLGYRQDRSQWLETAYCFGEETALQVRAIAYDDWQHFFDGEVHHCLVLAFVASTILLALLGAWSWDHFQQTVAKTTDNNTNSNTLIPAQEPEVALWKILEPYQAEIDQIKAHLATTINELERIRQHRDEGWAWVERLKSDYAQLSQIRSDDTETIFALRREVIQIGGQLRVASECERSLSVKTAKLERQLAERDLVEGASQGATEALSSRIQLLNDELVALRDLLASAESRKQLVEADRQNLALRNSKLADQNKEVIGKYAELKASHDRLVVLATQNEETNARYEVLKASYDQSLERLRQTDNERHQLALRNREISSECDALRISHEQQITAKAAQYAALRASHDRVREQALVREQADITREYESLQASTGQLPHLHVALSTLQQERDEAIAQVMSLQQQLDATTSATDEALGEAQQSVAQARVTEGALRQTVDGTQRAFDEERAAATEARTQVSSLREEVEDLQSKIGMAMRDAQRSHEEAMAYKNAIGILEHRLSKWELRDSAQEIPKRQTGNLGSISTALQQKEVLVAQQQGEINALKLQLAQPGAAQPSDNAAIKANFEKLRTALDKERRARTEDQLRWDKRCRELEADNQKLRISMSNAVSPRRPVPRSPLARP
ncbi:hypothetical protein ASPWEDRAFT_716851 [Aspergillus wentii DTO 134E9]|uniref:Uncharacterized protein n=1 Tax=Aspergillus wentii DTO 134E9 TaxID=1073089 RepID=A0A1L9R6H1_ASPWE|nr:uncharacterized protein ASPWEDRAFT_716851 [Aspergillus wentii DTO 134E9]OJJ30522.1 hypothetical protein ASPWEDRAFT_716851 [Aspergillus wentii DTO 134E9]